MGPFVLVPGAFLGGWCYIKLQRLLESKGHHVLAPALTGVGELSHLSNLGNINLDTHIQDIVNLIEWNELKDVILCGHSYAGLVITGVADRIPQRINTLVYIDAELPTKTGDTLLSLLPSIGERVIQAVGTHGGSMVPPFPSSIFGTAPENQHWIDGKQTPQPLATFTQQIRLQGAFQAVTNRVLIYDTKDIGSPRPMAGWYEALRGKPGHHVFGIEGGHYLMIDKAEEIAEILSKHT